MPNHLFTHLPTHAVDSFLTSGTSSIRSADWTDASAVYAFLCELEEAPLDQTKFQTIFRHNLTNPAVHYFVAEEAGVLIGFISCHIQYLLHHIGKIGEIQELFVRSEYRNARVGQQLLDAVTALAVREGCVNLEVTTNQRRTDAIRFYERAAFRRSHYKLVKPIQA